MTISELAQRFFKEACELKEATSSGEPSVSKIAGTLQSWVTRLGAIGNNALQALIQSRALDVALSGLTQSSVGRATMRASAGIISRTTSTGSEGMEDGAVVPALRVIITSASAAPSFLIGKLLQLLADVAEVVVEKHGGEEHIVGEQDVQWLLVLMSAAIYDVSEARFREVKSLKDSVEATITEVTTTSSESAGPTTDKVPDISLLKNGALVWAEWIGNGHWYKAQVKSTDGDRVEVEWMDPPEDTKVPEDEEYRIAVGAEYLSVVAALGDYTKSSTVAVTAVVLGDQDRPALAVVEENGWSLKFEAAQTFNRIYHELQHAPTDISLACKQHSKGFAVVTEKLSTVVGSLSALRQEGERRAEAFGSTSDPKAGSGTHEVLNQDDAGSRRLLLDVVAASQELEAYLTARAQTASTIVGDIAGLEPSAAAMCLQSDRMRRRRLEELLVGLQAALYGPDAEQLAHNPSKHDALKDIISRAGKFVEVAWREMVQLAAETLGDRESRVGKRFKEMRSELQADLKQAAKLRPA